jgi:hypothetical protein
MPWSVDNIYQYTRFLMNKNQAGGISATDLFNAWNAEQAKYHDDLVGKWEKQNLTRTGVMSGLIEDEITISKLSPFIVPVTINVAGGLGFKPADYIYGVALRINDAKVFQVAHDTIWAVKDDVIDPPSIAEDSYYYTEYLTYFLFLPPAIKTFDLDYVAETTDIVWGFTLDANNRQVYNPATSVQPKWNKNTVITITDRTLKLFGLHFDSREFEQFGESNIRTGD